MGLSTEQTVAVIEAVGDVVNNQPKPEPNYWLLVIIPAVIGPLVAWWLNRKGRK